MGTEVEVEMGPEVEMELKWKLKWQDTHSHKHRDSRTVDVLHFLLSNSAPITSTSTNGHAIPLPGLTK